MAVAQALGQDSEWQNVVASGGATVATLVLLLLMVSKGESGRPERDAQAFVFAPGELIAMGNDASQLPGGRQGVVLVEPEPSTASQADPAPSDDATPSDDTAPPTLSDVATPARPVSAPRRNRTPKPREAPASDARSKLPPPGQGLGSGGRRTGLPAGFSDRVRDGDPWATDVLSALARAPVGTFGGALPTGTLRFTLAVCPDGSIRSFRSTRSGTTMDSEGVDRVKLAIGNVRVPTPPAAMGDKCTRLNYTFAWTAAGVR